MIDPTERRKQWLGIGAITLVVAGFGWMAFQQPVVKASRSMEIAHPEQDYLLAFYDDDLATCPSKLLVVSDVDAISKAETLAVKVDGEKQVYPISRIKSYTIPRHAVAMGWHEGDGINLTTIRQP